MAVLRDEQNGTPYLLTVENGTLYITEGAFIPVIIGASLSPNPAVPGQPVLISVAAQESISVPMEFSWPSGQAVSGEVRNWP